MDDADSEAGGSLRCSFPLPADLGHEAFSGSRFFGKDFFAVVAIEADSGSAEQHLWPMFQPRQHFHQRLRGSHPAVADSLLFRFGPAAFHQTLPRQMNGGTNAVQPPHVLAELEAVGVPVIGPFSRIRSIPNQRGTSDSLGHEVAVEGMAYQAGGTREKDLRKDFHCYNGHRSRGTGLQYS